MRMQRGSCHNSLVMGLAVSGILVQAQSPGFRADQFPAHDSHQEVTIAAVPVPDTREAERIFGRNAAPTRGGFLPVELILTNQRGEAIRIDLERIQVVSNGVAFEQVDPETLAWGLYPPPRPKRPIDSTRLPPKLPKDKHRTVREEAEAALRSRQLRAVLLPPGGSARGYLYFDLRRQSIDLAASSVYIPSVELPASGEELLFFEISLKPYAREKPDNPGDDR